MSARRREMRARVQESVDASMALTAAAQAHSGHTTPPSLMSKATLPACTSSTGSPQRTQVSRHGRKPCMAAALKMKAAVSRGNTGDGAISRASSEAANRGSRRGSWLPSTVSSQAQSSAASTSTARS